MFQDDLLEWYKTNHRVLPWRENHDPYRIWLSEIMLQQTQVSTVIDYYQKFIKRYPTVQTMAEAEEQEVLKLWEGLGYYSRARRLIPCAKMIMASFEGRFPERYKDMLKLPGVGPYTAGAILSIAYNQKVPAVDGNVMRVYARYFDMANDISNTKTRKIFEEKVLLTLPEDRRHFNQALMELGATICTPKSPRCDKCPIKENCQAKAKELIDKRPVKTKRIKQKKKQMVVVQLLSGNKMMLVKRPDQGLLAGLWGFPCYEIEGTLAETVYRNLEEEFDIIADVYEVLKEDKHVFTHLIWEMTFIRIDLKETFHVDYPQMQWIDRKRWTDYPLPVAFSKLMEVKSV